MNKDVFTPGDLALRAGVSPESLETWTNARLVRPAGYADDRTPLYAPEALDRIAHIRSLEDLGYGLEEVQKIVRKVGLPAGGGEKGKKKPKKGPYLTVGSLAERSGVSPRTIKHWEDKGIIEPDMRTEGGFRLYSESYVFLCQLIRDLQLFGYTLEEIKDVSGEVRDFLSIEADLAVFPRADVGVKLEGMLGRIQALRDKMSLLKEGIERWEDLLKKKRKDVRALRVRNRKRPGTDAAPKKGETDA
ncbi:MAG TPA: MerR family transcriptional regulator [Acidobacteriota bacterium]|nr:MerR family transcriptional regulator [Acidobacteriota bacterium]